MTWLSHSVVAFSSAYILGLNPFMAMVGSTAPDWFEDFLGVKEHRGITHYLIYWLVAFVGCFVWWFFSSDFWLANVFSSFVFGGFSHIVLDSLTVSGVPLGVGNIRVRIGGLIKTGAVSEYVFLGVFLLAVSPFVLSGSSFGFNSAKALYERGVIDKREYEELKFRFFQ